MSTYLREMERARRDIGELVVRLAGPVTVTELAQAIGLIYGAHRALLSAMNAHPHHTEGPQG